MDINNSSVRSCVRATAVVLLAAAIGCRTTKDVLDDYERDLSTGQYAHAATEVGENADEGGRDALFWQLHAAGAKSLAADMPEAIRRFDLAEDAFVKNDGQSVFAQGSDVAFAMLTNDKAFPYAGTGQDRIFTCLYKAIDYGVQGRTDAMRTELNRAAQHQENWLYERGQDIKAADERLRKDAAAYRTQNNAKASGDDAGAVDRAMADAGLCARVKTACNFDPATDGRLETLSTKDYMNVYVQVVCGLFRWLSGENDGKYFLRDAAALKPETAMLKGDLAAANAGGKPKGNVWVFVEDGLCPRRKEWRIDLPLVLIPGLNRYVLYAGMAFPQLEARAAAASAYAVSAGGQTVQMAELESVDRLLKTEYDVYMRGAMPREITRAIVKASVQIALGVTAQNIKDDYTRIALQASQLAAAAWAVSVTGADIRTWTGLPKSVFACRVPRPETGELTVVCGNERIALKIPPGNSMVFVRKPGAAANSVAKVVNFPS